jgi:hypothetical protein
MSTIDKLLKQIRRERKCEMRFPFFRRNGLPNKKDHVSAKTEEEQNLALAANDLLPDNLRTWAYICAVHVLRLAYYAEPRKHVRTAHAYLHESVPHDILNEAEATSKRMGRPEGTQLRNAAHFFKETWPYVGHETRVKIVAAILFALEQLPDVELPPPLPIPEPNVPEFPFLLLRLPDFPTESSNIKS